MTKPKIIKEKPATGSPATGKGASPKTGKKAPKEKPQAKPAYLITPEIALQAAGLLHITNYNPVLVIGTAGGELLSAIENTLNGVSIKCFENDTEALAKIKSLVADGKIKALLVDGSHKEKYDKIIIDATGISNEGLVDLLSEKNALLLNDGGRMVVIVSSAQAKSQAVKNFIKAYDGWIDTDVTHDMCFLCLNYKDQVG